MDPEQLTASIARSLEVEDSFMKQSGDIQPITVNGTAGGSVELETVSPVLGADGRAQGERDWLVAVPRGHGRVVFIVFVAPETHFQQVKPIFEKMVESVQF